MEKTASINLILTLVLSSAIIYHNQVSAITTTFDLSFKCFGNWVHFPDQHSNGAVSHGNYFSTAEACRHLCQRDTDCYGVDYDRNKNECWVHEDASTLTSRRSSPGVDQYRLDNRYCGASPSTQAPNPGMPTSFGPPLTSQFPPLPISTTTSMSTSVTPDNQSERVCNPSYEPPGINQKFTLRSNIIKYGAELSLSQCQRICAESMGCFALEFVKTDNEKATECRGYTDFYTTSDIKENEGTDIYTFDNRNCLTAKLNPTVRLQFNEIASRYSYNDVSSVELARLMYDYQCKELCSWDSQCVGADFSLNNRTCWLLYERPIMTMINTNYKEFLLQSNRTTEKYVYKCQTEYQELANTTISVNDNSYVLLNQNQRKCEEICGLNPNCFGFLKIFPTTSSKAECQLLMNTKYFDLSKGYQANHERNIVYQLRRRSCGYDDVDSSSSESSTEIFKPTYIVLVSMGGAVLLMFFIGIIVLCSNPFKKRNKMSLVDDQYSNNAYSNDGEIPYESNDNRYKDEMRLSNMSEENEMNEKNEPDTDSM